jgi:hypothetical protein
MIDKAPKMDVFQLEEVELDGTKGDIIVLSKALRWHPCLEEFHMTTVTFTTDAYDLLSLDQVVSMILVSVPDLRHVKLERVVPVSSSALETAVYCTSLPKTPIVPQSGLTDRDAMKLAEAVAQSPSIPLIDIPGNLSDDGCDAFATTALDKNSSIQRVRLEGNHDKPTSGEQRSRNETSLRERAGGRAHAA